MGIVVGIREEESFMKGIFDRFKRRDFSGDTGQAMKNSSYQLGTNLIMKIGGLLFTIIIARLLQPEKMGLYNLALSTIILFSIFSDLGIGTALITYLAKAFANGDTAKAKGYILILFKWKIKLLLISSFTLLIGSYFISKYYYQKPIFYATLIGLIYIPIVQSIGLIENVFRAKNKFKAPMVQESIFQITRLVLIPPIMLLLLHFAFSNKIFILFAILSLTFCYLISLLFIFFKAKKDFLFLKIPKKNLNKKEINDLKRFILPLSATALAGTMFGYIDTLMLGGNVPTNFIAYYGAAFALIGAASTIIGFMTAAIMPIFSKESGTLLENMFKKTMILTFIVSISAAIFTHISAWWIIRLAYGTGYLDAVPILKWFSILLIISAVTGIYSTYFISQKRTKVISVLLITSTVFNIVFNIVFINWGINHYGDIGGVYGAVFATILSRIIYLSGLIFWKKRNKFTLKFSQLLHL
jgi:O-antigen/teichoic acid export membrane protein